MMGKFRVVRSKIAEYRAAAALIEEEGLSVRAACRRAGISPQGFRNIRRRLGEAPDRPTRIEAAPASPPAIVICIEGIGRPGYYVLTKEYAHTWVEHGPFRTVAAAANSVAGARIVVPRGAAA